MRKRAVSPIVLITVLTFTLGSSGVGLAGQTTLRPPSLRQRAADGGVKKAIAKAFWLVNTDAGAVFSKNRRKEAIRREIRGRREKLAPLLAQMNDFDDLQTRVDPGIRQQALVEIRQIVPFLEWLIRLGATEKEQALKEELLLRQEILRLEIAILRQEGIDRPHYFFQMARQHASHRFNLTMHLWEQRRKDPMDPEVLKTLDSEARWASFFVERTADWLRDRTEENAFSYIDQLGAFAIHTIPGVEARASDPEFLETEMAGWLTAMNHLVGYIEGSVPELSRSDQGLAYEVLLKYFDLAVKVLLRGMVLSEGYPEARNFYLDRALNVFDVAYSAVSDQPQLTDRALRLRNDVITTLTGLLDESNSEEAGEIRGTIAHLSTYGPKAPPAVSDGGNRSLRQTLPPLFHSQKLLEGSI